MTDFVMVAADSSPPGAYTGFQRAFSGSMTPDTFLEFEIIRCQNDYNAGSTFVFQLDGTLTQDAFASITILDSDIGEVTLNTATADGFSDVGDVTTWSWEFAEDVVLFTDGNTYNLTTPSAADDTFNCECEETSGFETLAQLRRRMLIRGGYAAMADNPPPGIVALMDEFLVDAQRQLYEKNITLRMTRLFKWTMVLGQRFYGFADEEGNCKAIDPDKIKWVGYEDLNQAWYPLACGISPTLYTRVNTMSGYPQRYEIRSCIEIWPAPQAAYTLWIKGDFGLDALVEPTDRTSIPSQAVFLLALGNYLLDKGKPSADAVLTQAGNYVKDLVANTHKTARYIPSAGLPPPAIPPKFLPLGDAPP